MSEKFELKITPSNENQMNFYLECFKTGITLEEGIEKLKVLGMSGAEAGEKLRKELKLKMTDKSQKVRVIKAFEIVSPVAFRAGLSSEELLAILIELDKKEKE